MKIAILTLPLENNYGGNLQAYALYTILKKMGNDVELINYRRPEMSDFRKILSTIKQKVIHKRDIFYFFDKEKKIVNKNHEEFIRSYINCSNPLYSTTQLIDYFNRKKFHAVIVGSDQVWRFEYSPKLEDYFLEFLESNNRIKKISYAASFGIDSWNYPEHITKKVNGLIQKFNYVSVREDSGVKLCRNKLSINSTHVVDPTLLLKREEYLDLIDKNNDDNTGKILTYILDDSDFKDDFILKAKKHLKKDVFKAQPEFKSRKSLFDRQLQSYIYPSIEDWIKSFHDASFIVTDSFHGTVFAIIFNKPFVSIVNKKRGASRFDSLLRKLNLMDRMVGEDVIIRKDLFENQIDYIKVNNILDEWVAYSYNELKTALVERE